MPTTALALLQLGYLIEQQSKAMNTKTKKKPPGYEEAFMNKPRKQITPGRRQQNAKRSLRRLAMPPAEIQKELRREVAMYRRSYSEVDGVVRDEGALRTISALTEAIEIVRRHSCELTDGGHV